MKYLRDFENHSDYLDYKEGSEYSTPGVAYCIGQHEVHYEPIPGAYIEIWLNVTNISAPVSITDNVSAFEYIEVDNEIINTSEMEPTTLQYSFQETGEHYIKLMLNKSNNGRIPSRSVYYMNYIEEVEFSKGIKAIESQAFYVSRINSLNMPTSVTEIEDNAFYCGDVGPLATKTYIQNINPNAINLTDCK